MVVAVVQVRNVGMGVDERSMRVDVAVPSRKVVDEVVVMLVGVFVLVNVFRLRVSMPVFVGGVEGEADPCNGQGHRSYLHRIDRVAQHDPRQDCAEEWRGGEIGAGPCRAELA